MEAMLTKVDRPGNTEFWKRGSVRRASGLVLTAYAVHRIMQSGLMRRILLCGLPSARNHRYPGCFSLRIKEGVVKDAMSLSLAWKRPDLSFGAVTASRASSLIDGSTRV